MPRVAVITPYYKERTPTLLQCIRSVAAQKVATSHFMIADGHANPQILEEDINHVILPQSHGDNGNTARGLGSLLAAREDYEFIAYLDADNWYHPSHLSSLLELWRSTGSAVCTSFRTFHSVDGDEMLVEEPDELNLSHVDTSCFLLHRSAFKVLDVWLNMPKALSPVCDRIFLASILRRRYQVSSTRQKTVAFRSRYKEHYSAAGLPPPADAKENVGRDAYNWLATTEGIRTVVDGIGFYPL